MGVLRAITTMSIGKQGPWCRRYSRITLRNRLRSTARRIFFFDVMNPTRWSFFLVLIFAKIKKSRVLLVASGLLKISSKSLRDGKDKTVIKSPQYDQADKRLRPFARRRAIIWRPLFVAIRARNP